MALLRLFVAIETPPEIKSQIANVISELQSAQADVRWEQSEKIHITLKFLGETNEAQLAPILSALERISQVTNKFPIQYSTLGCFPDKRKPRIIWIGIEDSGAALERLAETIESSMVSFGFPKEAKTFSPHVTIGRVKSQKNMTNLLRTMESITLESQPREVSRIVLVKSELKPKGSVYRLVETFLFPRILSTDYEP